MRCNDKKCKKNNRNESLNFKQKFNTLVFLYWVKLTDLQQIKTFVSTKKYLDREIIYFEHRFPKF